MNSTNPNRITWKRWGFEYIVEDNSCYQVKFLQMNMSQQCSMHFHKSKRETITVLTGCLTIAFEHHSNVTLLKHESLTIPAGEQYAHRMIANNGNCQYLESAVSGCNNDNTRIKE
jgi:mannose-6-phosphate isomerase-like protein (cupin superfamily)